LFRYNCPLLRKDICPTTGIGLAVFVLLRGKKKIAPRVVSTSKMMRMTMKAMIGGLVSGPCSRLAGGSLLRLGGGGEDGDATSCDSCPDVGGGFGVEYAKEVLITCQI
jgi:hypothetical protein